MKKFFLTLLGVLVISGFSTGSAESKAVNANASQSTSYYYDTYIYQHVWIDGVRWLYIYTEDGNLVSAYPDPE